MEDVTWIADLKALGAFGSILIIFALSIRFLVVSHSRSVTRREEAVINMTQETIKMIGDHREVISLNTQVMREQVEAMRRGNSVIISQIKRSEANLKKQLIKGSANGKQN